MSKEHPLGPAVVLCCGSFSPITFMHLQILERARVDTIRRGYAVAYGVISPVHDGYGKPGLAPAEHRLAMTELAVRDSWIRASAWEIQQSNHSASWKVIEFTKREYTARNSGQTAIIVFVCGADLIEAMCDSNRWPVENVRRLLDKAVLSVERRPGSDIESTLRHPVFAGRTHRVWLLDGAESHQSSSVVR